MKGIFLFLSNSINVLILLLAISTVQIIKIATQSGQAKFTLAVQGNWACIYLMLLIFKFIFKLSKVQQTCCWRIDEQFHRNYFSKIQSTNVYSSYSDFRLPTSSDFDFFIYYNKYIYTQYTQTTILLLTKFFK